MLVIVRHGKTFMPHEPAVWIGAHQDPDLTPEGRAQAAAFGRALQPLAQTLLRVDTSPMRRTQGHAREALLHMGSHEPPHDATALRELHYGAWANRTRNDILAAGGEAALGAWELEARYPQGVGFGPPMTEQLLALRGWLDAVAQAVTPRPGAWALAVTHGGILRLLGAKLLGPNPTGAPLKMACGHAAVLVWSQGSWHIHAWNVPPDESLTRATTSTHTPQPLRALPEIWSHQDAPRALSRALSGMAGANRSSEPNALGAHDDLQAVQQFLAEYAHAPATLRTYTKEIERLILWAHVSHNKALSDLNRADFAAYSAFLADPQPAALWCGPRRGRGCTRKSPSWRPFVGPLGPSAQRSALIIINILMSWLTRAGYLRQNPLSLMRRQSQHALTSIDAGLQVRQRVFDDAQWGAVIDTLHGPSSEDFPDAKEALRARFLVAVMYFLALRVGELTSHTMGHFRNVQGRWVFYVVGKGNKAAEVPANDSLMEEVRLYRRSLGLQPDPLPHETTPLVPNSSHTQAVGARRINQIIKNVVYRASLRLETTQPHRAAHMRHASAHWFRHTSLTRQAQAGLHFSHIKANARHARLDTTMIYIHTEDAQRHEAMQAHTWD